MKQAEIIHRKQKIKELDEYQRSLEIIQDQRSNLVEQNEFNEIVTYDNNETIELQSKMIKHPIQGTKTQRVNSNKQKI